jgi:hypothetical protein
LKTAPQLTHLEVEPDSVVSGAAAELVCTVFLDGPAPPGGTPVTLEARPPGIVDVPDSVIVPGSEEHTSFNFQVVGVGANSDVTLTASVGPVAKSAIIHMAAAAADAESTSLALIDTATTSTIRVQETVAPAVSRRTLLRPSNAERRGRHYRYSSLPVLVTHSLELTDANKLTVLLATYTEVTASWRTLTDVRFKLLGLVPLASVVLLAGLLKSDTPIIWLLALVGLIATAGLWVYDRRNSQLYDDLISRGRRIEAELGLDTGQFLGRKDPSRVWLTHSTATNLVYLGSFGAWAGALIWLTLRARL